MMRPRAERRARHWDRVYDDTDDTRLSWFEAEPRCSLELLDALGARPEEPVIDIGTGASHLIDALLGRGFRDVSALDIAAGGPSRTCARVGVAAEQVHWTLGDLLTWVPPRRYAVWHDRGMFHFLTARADRSRYLDTLCAALAPGGAVVIGVFAEDGPVRCAGLRTARYSPDALARAVTRDPATETVALVREMHPTPDGVLQPLSWLAARRW